MGVPDCSWAPPRSNWIRRRPALITRRLPHLDTHSIRASGRDRPQIADDGLATLLQRSISDRELERAFEQVDAAHFLFVVGGEARLGGQRSAFTQFTSPVVRCYQAYKVKLHQNRVVELVYLEP